MFILLDETERVALKRERHSNYTSHNVFVLFILIRGCNPDDARGNRDIIG
jgi:hypothetical protein